MTYSPKPPCHPHCKQGRHVFTRDERALGYERAMIAVDERHPEWRCRHGAALSHCLLRAKRPEYFVVRDLERRVTKLERNHREGLDGIKQQLALLKKQVKGRAKRGRTGKRGI